MDSIIVIKKMNKPIHLEGIYIIRRSTESSRFHEQSIKLAPLN